MNLLRKIEQEQIDSLVKEQPIVQFNTGDTIRVSIKRIKLIKSLKKGKPAEPKVYTEKYQGVCISKTNKGMGSSFTVRTMTNNTATLIKFPFFGTQVEVIEKGVTRRAKLYYLLSRYGRKAKIESERDYRSRKKIARSSSSANA